MSHAVWVRASIALAFVTDIALKMLVRRHPATAGRFAFWSSVGPIGIVPSTNDALAFSLPIPNTWIWPIGWIVVLALLVALGRISNFPPEACSQGASALGGDPPLAGRFQISDNRSVAILAIILGALSNLTDRTFLGGVTDYLSLTSIFPAFNISDLLILGGLAAWLWSVRRVVGNS